MSYSLHILRRTQKELAQLPRESYFRMRDSIRDLADNPRPKGCQKLTGRDGWRIRVGDFRVIYDVADNKQTVVILHVGHRRDVYR